MSAEHVKVTEELYSDDCQWAECEHEDKEACPLISVEVCSECREEFEDGDMVLLTLWATAEANGHKEVTS